MVYKYVFKCILVIIVLSTLHRRYICSKNNSILYHLEINKCPLCYGTNFCNEIYDGMVKMESGTFLDLIKDFFSTKNVFNGLYEMRRVVFKKLGHASELKQLDEDVCLESGLNKYCDVQKIKKPFSNRSNKYARLLCPCVDANKFIDELVSEILTLENILTILQINPEPLILSLLRKEDGWPVPQYYGACGRIIIEEYRGRSLNYFQNSNWFLRADIAVQLIESSLMFTNAHPSYSFYLTDISPDNIAVDDNHKISFIDLENVLIIDKKNSSSDSLSNKKKHISENMDCDDCFAFSEVDICNHEISDHNLFAVCKLLLSSKAPWPMMSGGLLHSPPDRVKAEYPELFFLVEQCVDLEIDQDRFRIASRILDQFRRLESVANCDI